MTSTSAYVQANIAELQAVADTLDESDLELLVRNVIEANRVYLTGVGRSGLAARAIAMRLMHIGVDAFVVGEVATPGISTGDLLVAVTATGRGSVLDQAKTALKLGARVAAITTQAQSELTEIANGVVVFPIRAGISTQQHAGSLFEQSALVVGDAICRTVQEQLNVPSSELDRRHANLS